MAILKQCRALVIKAVAFHNACDVTCGSCVALQRAVNHAQGAAQAVGGSAQRAVVHQRP
jgi:hypothetical protein